jgi:hypothetical protein
MGAGLWRGAGERSAGPSKAEAERQRWPAVRAARDGGHPWLVLSSDLARFERALAATE